MSKISVMLVPEAGKVRNLSVSTTSLSFAAIVLTSLLAVAAWGAWGVLNVAGTENQLTVTEQHLLDVEHQYQEETSRLREQIKHDRQQLAVLARNVGQLQAKLSRLDAVGSRLVEVAKLDESQFDFKPQPAFGGPRLVQGQEMGISSLDLGLENIDEHLGLLDAQLATIDFVMQQQRSKKAARPHGWPTEGGWVSSNFGMRTDPFTGELAQHRGVDIANRFDAPVMASSKGIVVFAGKQKDFGFVVEVAHGHGYLTRYGHLSAVKVGRGQQVEENEIVGTIGSSGRSTGPHLHYEVLRNGRYLDPRPFLPRA